MGYKKIYSTSEVKDMLSEPILPEDEYCIDKFIKTLKKRNLISKVIVLLFSTIWEIYLIEFLIDSTIRNTLSIFDFILIGLLIPIPIPIFLKSNLKIKKHQYAIIKEKYSSLKGKAEHHTTLYYASVYLENTSQYLSEVLLEYEDYNKIHIGEEIIILTFDNKKAYGIRLAPEKRDVLKELPKEEIEDTNKYIIENNLKNNTLTFNNSLNFQGNYENYLKELKNHYIKGILFTIFVNIIFVNIFFSFIFVAWFFTMSFLDFFFPVLFYGLAILICFLILKSKINKYLILRKGEFKCHYGVLKDKYYLKFNGSEESNKKCAGTVYLADLNEHIKNVNFFPKYSNSLEKDSSVVVFIINKDSLYLFPLNMN